MGSRTVRTDTELRLVELLAGLTGWDDSPDTPGAWWVRPWGRGQPEARRAVTVGVPVGSLDPASIAAAASAETDVWTCTVWITATDMDDGPKAKQAVEDAVNDLADLLARNPRLDMNPGPRSARISSFEGPFFEQVDGMALCNAEVEITFTADIWRPPA